RFLRYPKTGVPHSRKFPRVSADILFPSLKHRCEWSCSFHEWNEVQKAGVMVLKFLPAVRNGEQDTLGIRVETGGIMRNVPALIFFMAVGLLAVSVPLVAHHGNAAFDPASVTV